MPYYTDDFLRKLNLLELERAASGIMGAFSWAEHRWGHATDDEGREHGTVWGLINNELDCMIYAKKKYDERNK